MSVLQKSVYREFNKKSRAFAAIRALINVGVKPRYVEASQLSAKAFITQSDFGAGPKRMASTYILVGLFLGVFMGLLLALLVFWLPAELLQASYKNVLIIVGLIACAGAGGVVGIMEAFKRVKRRSKPLLSSGSKPAVGIRVWADSETEFKRAQSVLAFSHLSVKRIRTVRYKTGSDKNR